MSDILDKLEAWNNAEKQRSVTISIDNGYGATCWLVELHRGRRVVYCSETTFVAQDGVDPLWHEHAGNLYTAVYLRGRDLVSTTTRRWTADAPSACPSRRTLHPLSRGRCDGFADTGDGRHLWRAALAAWPVNAAHRYGTAHDGRVGLNHARMEDRRGVASDAHPR